LLVLFPPNGDIRGDEAINTEGPELIAPEIGLLVYLYEATHL
jgi:hypothetical protein